MNVQITNSCTEGNLSTLINYARYLDQESLLNEEEKPTVKQSISQEKLRVTEAERNGKKKSTLNGNPVY